MYLRFRRWLRRRRRGHDYTLHTSCSGRHAGGRLLALRCGDPGLRLSRGNTPKVTQRSHENVTGTLEEVNFSIKLSDYF